MYIFYSYQRKKTQISRRKRKAIEDEIISYEFEYPGTIRPISINHPEIQQNIHSVNIDIADEFKQLFYDHIVMILMKELILNKPNTTGNYLPVQF